MANTYHIETEQKKKGQTFPTEVILDYLYCNGFAYLFDE